MTPVESPLHLENLTAHPVTFDLESDPQADQSQGPGTSPGRVTLSPAGVIAKVDEPDQAVGPLRTDGGTLRQTLMTPSRRTVGLPSPRPGVVFVVPRLTALAARHRRDLVFPHGELRDPTGRIVGAAGLGRFRRRWSPAWARVIWARLSRTVRGKGLPSDWRIALWFSLGTAFGAAALGVGSDVVADGWTNAAEGAGRRRFVLVGGGLGCLWFLVAGTLLWRRRNRVLRQFGTAYVVDEIADAWTYEEKRSFQTDVRSRFASVLRVPGPADLGAAWAWPLDAGAVRWSEKTDTLVRSFWTTQFNDDPNTPNALFMWSYWPVSVAFAARTVVRRGLVLQVRQGLDLQVRQRPTFGRVGEREKVDWRQQPHTFAPVRLDDPLGELGKLSPAGDSVQAPVRWEDPDRKGRFCDGPGVQILTWPAVLDAVDAAGEEIRDREPGAVHILLVRMSDKRWGPIEGLSEPDAAAVTVTVRADPAVVRIGGGPATVHEFRSLPVGSPFHEWDDFNALAQAATQWIGAAARVLDGRLFVGLLVPQEVAMGIGVHAGRLAPGAGWPEQLWPLVWHDGERRFVVPGLPLGWGSLHPRGEG